MPLDSDYRSDVDGLRAVAICIVVIFHMQRSLVPGGFVGVDVFFVISGFLITRLIVDALERGTFSLSEFYSRRIRRIFPALIIVLAVVWIIGWLTLLPDDFAELGRQILAGAVFASNLLNYSEVGYFDAPAASKPLLHLWSLGVEEQFYLAIPAFLIVAMKCRIPFPRILAITAVLSCAGNIALVRYSQRAAFYLPISRLWELLIGGCIPYATARWSLQTERFRRESSSILGISLIGAAAYLVPAADFPGWWAVPPVLGSALIIAAGPEATVNRALSRRPLVGLGLISYPLYLWHWPLLVLLRGPTSKGRWIVALSVVLAAATYLLIEQPLRRSFRLPRIAIGGLTGMATMALLATMTAQTGGLPGRYDPPLPAIFLRVAQPNFFPAGYEAGNVAGPKVLLWGDSHADQLNPGFLAVRETRPLRLYHNNFGADCAPIRSQPEADRCADLLRSIESDVAAIHPDIVVIAALWSLYSPLDIAGLDDLLTFSRHSGAKDVFVVGPEPRWPQSLRVELADAYLKNPQSGVPKRLTTYIRLDPQLARSIRIAAESHGANYIAPMDKLCNVDGCLVRVGDNPGDIIQSDDSHFSRAGSEYFVNLIIGQILKNETTPLVELRDPR
jgi:peptidoglycan/LPS O-acetylase OafA/YrhL